MMKLKVAKISNSCPKGIHKSFKLKCPMQNRPKSYQKFGLFLKKICSQDYSKIAQSGHTAFLIVLNFDSPVSPCRWSGRRNFASVVRPGSVERFTRMSRSGRRQMAPTFRWWRTARRRIRVRSFVPEMILIGAWIFVIMMKMMITTLSGRFHFRNLQFLPNFFWSKKWKVQKHFSSSKRNYFLLDVSKCK